MLTANCFYLLYQLVVPILPESTYQRLLEELVQRQPLFLTEADSRLADVPLMIVE